MPKLHITKEITDGAWLHDENAEVAVPFELTARGGEVICRCYPEAEGLTDELFARFGESEDTLFSDGAAMWMTEKFDTFLADYGFELSPDSGDYYINYRLSDVQCEIGDGIVRIYGDEGYEDLTDTDVQGFAEYGFIMYAAVVDGKIVAIANTGEPICDDTPEAVEIGVDTAEKYRRKGYGKACIAALVKELKALGHTAIYECASKNTASVKLIESLGGELCAKKMYAVGFRAE